MLVVPVILVGFLLFLLHGVSNILDGLLARVGIDAEDFLHGRCRSNQGRDERCILELEHYRNVVISGRVDV